METHKSQKYLTGNPPAFSYPDPERETYHLRLRFEYGNLDDGTLWIRTPKKGLFHIDWLILRFLLELNAGMPFTPLCKKYKIDPNEWFVLNLFRLGIKI